MSAPALLADAIHDLMVSQDIGKFAGAVASIIHASLKDLDNALATALDTLATGYTMLADDIHDLGLFDRIHHWIIGLVILILGLIILILVVLKALELI